jgi:hypothetical protein
LMSSVADAYVSCRLRVPLLPLLALQGAVNFSSLRDTDRSLAPAGVRLLIVRCVGHVS